MTLPACLSWADTAHKIFLGTDGRLQWETLVTGFAAVVAAGVTICRLNAQIKQAGDLAAEQRRRKARAAQAMLPLALSELGEYATACIAGLYSLRPCFTGDGGLDRSAATNELAKWSPPTLPENVLSLLKDCIEFCEDRPAEAIRDLVRHFQIQHLRIVEDIARLRLNDGVRLLLWANIEQAIQDAAELYARGALVFPFARGSPAHIAEVARPQIYSALFAAGCFQNLGEIDALADRWVFEFEHRAQMQPKDS